MGEPSTSDSLDSPGASPASKRLDRYAITRRVTLVGAACDLFLSLIKIVGGFLAQSQALIADGVHSLSDLVTDAMVLLAARHAHAAPDSDHPYGHERIETIATAALGTILVLIGVGIAWDSVRRLTSVEPPMIPEWWALIIAAVSALSKEAIFRYTLHAARRIDSKLLEANAWHSRSDAASSLVVIVGVGGTLAGATYLDIIAALVVAVMIGRTGILLAWRGGQELIDTALDPDEVEAIRSTLLELDDVRDLHMLRTRRMGPKSLVDVHILVGDPKISVSEGHQISEIARAMLIRRFPAISDVTVHIDPENDEEVIPGRDLPLRKEVLAYLRASWADTPEAKEIRRITLHYLDGAIDVDVELPLALAVERAGSIPGIGGVGIGIDKAKADRQEGALGTGTREDRGECAEKETTARAMLSSAQSLAERLRELANEARIDPDAKTGETKTRSVKIGKIRVLLV
ncbi:cation diffusion facilitator family transporter [Thioalkalivibrio sp. HK1]|uniref:cation diffusion facilitator family transporter n=1 Tax=Thioalkalivibrio sp. HK1 TaxID=1469245 RepID=UPI00046F36C1|nr:cation diffusion facilitator family transporter [Thioalkalivibrio sp. HK1]